VKSFVTQFVVQRGLACEAGGKLHSPSPSAVVKRVPLPPAPPLPLRCCFTIPITLFTVSYPPLTVWNSRLHVAKFLSGQYTLSAPDANCLRLSPALPTTSGKLPPCALHYNDNLSHSRLERTKSQTDSQLAILPWFLVVRCCTLPR
jgi:hypothetical protein